MKLLVKNSIANYCVYKYINYHTHLNKRCPWKICHYVTKVSHSTLHLPRVVISTKYLNIMQQKAIEKQVTKKIKQNQSKERQEKQIRSVASLLIAFERVACKELKK